MENELRGFAAEGVGMGLALLDTLTPWRRDRLRGFLEGPGRDQAYMLHVGAGWALAWPLTSPRRLLTRLDPLLGWMALDGFGFHRAFFHWERTSVRQILPRRLGKDTRWFFDIGVGRRLWFLDDPGLGSTLAAIAAFPPSRQGDLWTGLGEACTFGGGREPAALDELRQAAGPWLPQLAQGVAFSAEVRERAGNPAPHAELACRRICGMSAAETAAACREAGLGLPHDGKLPACEVWRRRLHRRFGDLRGLQGP